MSAALRKAKSLFSTTLSASIGTGTGETITLASATGLPTSVPITLTIDRVDSNGVATPAKMERITGTISGTSLTSYTRGTDGSTEQAHSSGAVIEYIWSANDWNDHIDAHLAIQAQDGNIKSGAQINDTSADHQYVLGVSELAADRTITLPVLTGNDEFTFKDVTQTLTNKTLTAPILGGTVTGTYTLGGTPTISSPAINTPTLVLTNGTTTTDGGVAFDRTNEDLSIGDGAASQIVHMGAWKAFTPDWGGITEGSGTSGGAYCKIGKTVHFRARFVLAANSSITGAVTLPLPLAAVDYLDLVPIGFARLIDANGGTYIGMVISNGAVWVSSASAAYIQEVALSSTVPFTWASGDSLIVCGTYQTSA